MVYKTEPKLCTGCQCCRLICPALCINMKDDAEGFAVPVIDEARCTDCGLCARYCPENGYRFIANDNLKVYAARLKNDALLKNSASGGVFAGLAQMFLDEHKGVVYGCAYDEHLVAKHISVTDIKDIKRLQSSKYVQSDVKDTYKQVKELLAQTDKKVLYTGTPCQIAGLLSYLDNNYPNLLTVDLICHGVPSPLLFKRHIEAYEKKIGEKIRHCNLRDKTLNGWGSDFKIMGETKTIYADCIDVPYMVGFLNRNTLRDCCYTCRYADKRRAADITIGDYWGIEEAHPQFYDKRGVSVVLINTVKAERYLNEARDKFEIIESSFEKAARHQLNLRCPTARPPLRDNAYKHINSDTADIFKEPAFNVGLVVRFKTFVKRVLPNPIVKVLKRLKRSIQTSG